MDARTLTSLLPELDRFLARFADCFADCRSREHLRNYVRGQLSDLDRKSVEPMALRAGVPPRSLQEFLSQFVWDPQRLRDHVQRIVATEHAGPHTVGLIDETSTVKKGTKTPGVQRQWCGHAGKVENCIVTVHLGYVHGDFQCLLDGELYLPQAWDQDRARCRAAGIPDDVVYRPKWQIALEQYDHAVANGVTFDWLTFDEHYGSKPQFLAALSRRGQAFVAEVPKSTCGWCAEPRITMRPRRPTAGGRPLSEPRLWAGNPPARRADWLLSRATGLREKPWRRFRFDDREKGPSVWEAKHVRFWPSAAEGVYDAPLHLVVARHVLSKGELKFFLSNAPEGTPTETLLWVALTRHRVERCFQDQKSELGLDHFEGRTHRGLTRHLMLTCVSSLFLMRATQKRRGEKPGVDRATGASRPGTANRGAVVRWSDAAATAGAVGRRDRVSSSPQRAGSKESREAHAARITRAGHPTHRCRPMQTARVAL